MMHHLLSIISTTVLCSLCMAQPETKRVAIANTGCTAEVYCAPGRFDVYDIEDGSTVYADDCETGGITFGIY